MVREGLHDSPQRLLKIRRTVVAQPHTLLLLRHDAKVLAHSALRQHSQRRDVRDKWHQPLGELIPAAVIRVVRSLHGPLVKVGLLWRHERRAVRACEPAREAAPRKRNDRTHVVEPDQGRLEQVLLDVGQLVLRHRPVIVERVKERSKRLECPEAEIEQTLALDEGGERHVREVGRVVGEDAVLRGHMVDFDQLLEWELARPRANVALVQGPRGVQVAAPI